ncbi:MAG: hypothetical protein LBT10_01610 [Methanobrevibacter sp.]|jgi:hypothetical protein|nr:hypothetical protein [Methanobrevibacter sp.]
MEIRNLEFGFLAENLGHIPVIKLLSSVFNFSIVKIHANFTVPIKNKE